MPVYKFIGKNIQGKDMRGECEAKDVKDLAFILKGTGLILEGWQEQKPHRGGTVATPPFVQDVAGIIKELKKPKFIDDLETPKTRQLGVFVAVALVGGALAAYYFFHSQSALRAKTTLEPNVVKQINHYKAQDTPTPE